MRYRDFRIFVSVLISYQILSTRPSSYLKVYGDRPTSEVPVDRSFLASVHPESMFEKHHRVEGPDSLALTRVTNIAAHGWYSKEVPHPRIPTTTLHLAEAAQRGHVALSVGLVHEDEARLVRHVL